MRALGTVVRSFGIPFLFLAMAVRLAWIPWSQIKSGIWVDTDVYAMGGRIASGGGDLYSALSDKGLPFTYSPFAALVFVPLGASPVALGRVAFTGVSLACFLLVLLLLSRRLTLPFWKAAAIGAFFIGIEPMVRDLLLGQINLFLMALVVTDHLLVPKRFRGVLTGVAAGIKITPAAFVMLFVLRREWRSAMRSGLAFLATITLGWLLAPTASARYWGGGVIQMDKFGSAAVIGSDNQSLLACWMRITSTVTPPSEVKLMTLILGLGLGVGAAWAEYRTLRPDSHVAALGWVALGALLGSPISWSHHWVWWLVPLSVLVSRKRAMPAVPLTLVMWFPTIWTVGPGALRELSFTPLQVAISCAYCMIGIFVLAYALISSARILRDQRVMGPLSSPRELPHNGQKPQLVEILHDQASSTSA